MGKTYWRFALFIKESAIERTKQTIAGIGMGGISAYNLLWIGPIAENLGWLVKGIGSVALAFFSGLATSYAGYLIERHKESQKRIPIKKRKRA